MLDVGAVLCLVWEGCVLDVGGFVLDVGGVYA